MQHVAKKSQPDERKRKRNRARERYGFKFNSEGDSWITHKVDCSAFRYQPAYETVEKRYSTKHSQVVCALVKMSTVD